MQSFELMPKIVRPEFMTSQSYWTIHNIYYYIFLWDKIFHSDMYFNQLVMSKYSYFISMAQLIICCISSDHGILDGHKEDVDPLMLLIQDILEQNSSNVHW